MVLRQFMIRYKLQLLSFFFLPIFLLLLAILSFALCNHTHKQSVYAARPILPPSTTLGSVHILVKTALITVNRAYPLLL